MIVDQFGAPIEDRDPDKNLIIKQYLDRQSDGDYSNFMWAVHPQCLGRLSYSMLRYLYETSSSIRPAVDSISREVSNLPWMVIKNNFKYFKPSATKGLTDFLKKPNLDNDTFSTLIASYIHDMLVVGKGVIEKVRNPLGDLMELKSRDATLYTPRVNSYGFIVDYIEYKKDTTTPARYHNKDDLIFEWFTPTSYTLGAIPIIETIVNEVALLMLCTKSLGWAFTRDEIPPGVLHLGTIGLEALNRAKASFEAAKGIATQYKLRVVDNVDTVQWVAFQKSNRDMQVAELIPMIERVVYRNFGLSPVESSQTDISRQVAGVSFQSSQSKMVSPVMNKVAERLNNEVISELDDTALFMFNRSPQDSFSDQAKDVNELVDRAVISINEGRMLKLGLPPVLGGDKRTYKLGNEIAEVDENTGEIKYRNPPATQQNSFPSK